MSSKGVQEALRELLAGNRRFAEGRPDRPRGTGERRNELVGGQQPFAVIVGCSDSRVPPEIIFDCGLGDLFVIRVAGNVVDDLALGSIEYAVEHLGVRLVLVLGHSGCGAVRATVEGGHAGGHIASLVQAIRPAYVLAQGEAGDPVDNTVRANVRRVVDRVRLSLEIKEGAQGPEGAQVAAAVYSLESGLVEFL